MTNNRLNSISWPPTYTHKKNPRARHVKLKASLHHGLEVVTPMRFSEKNIPDILENNKQWILKKLSEIEELRLTSDHSILPETISFHAINEIWKIHYIKSDNKKVTLIPRPQQELVVMGHIEDIAACKMVLAKWVRRYSHSHLTTMLNDLSNKTKLPFSLVTIRSQRSRWGSCSATKIINLNYKLIFLPFHLTSHIIIHELCHTQHLNHSVKFWRLVASFDPKWKQHNSEIRQAEKYIPAWINL